MFKLPDLSESGAAAWSTVPAWRACDACEDLFAAQPGESLCRGCGGDEPDWAERCEAAHPADRSECEGAPDAVRVVDHAGDELHGCVRHAAMALVSIPEVWACPGSVPWAASDASALAQVLEPLACDLVMPVIGGTRERGAPA